MDGEAREFNSPHLIEGLPAVRNNFDRIFEIEIDSWCYGLSQFKGEITPALVHRVIKELAALFCAAIDNNYVFNVHEVVNKFSKASMQAVSHKELTVSIMLHLPQPFALDEEGQFVLAQVIDQAEQRYEGILALLEKRWREKKKPARRQNQLVLKSAS